MRNDLLHAVSHVPILCSLPESELLAILPKLSLVEYRVGSYIIREGKLDSDIYFIAEGQVKICHADYDGKEVILTLLNLGDSIGEISALTQIPRTSDVIAILPCLLIKISGKDFCQHVEIWPGLSSRLLRLMSEKLFIASQRISELALHDVQTRTVNILLSISQLGEYQETIVPIVNPRPTHQDIANMVGASREVISRTLKILEERGQILIDEDQIILLPKVSR